MTPARLHTVESVGHVPVFGLHHVQEACPSRARKGLVAGACQKVAPNLPDVYRQLPDALACIQQVHDSCKQRAKMAYNGTQLEMSNLFWPWNLG
jgi:hypothetical protein